MTLNGQANHPSARSYVLKLHRDSLPDDTRLAGRLENMATGRWFDFRSGAELLARLAQDIASDRAAPDDAFRERDDVIPQDPFN